MKQSAGNSPEGMPVVDLIAVRHIEIAVPRHILKEAVHRSDCWLANQSQRCLIQIHTVAEAWILRTIQ